MSDQNEQPTTIDELTARIERGRAAFYAALDGLSDAELAAPLTDRGWSVADHMAHIAVWMEGIVGALDGRDRWAVMGAGPPVGGDYDALNEELRARRGALVPADARAWLDATHAQLLAKLGGMTIEELRRPYRHYQPGEERPNADAPFLGWIIGDSYEHYDEHRGWITAALQARGRSA
jgi:uncharacterized damage-inducible protein DinB